MIFTRRAVDELRLLGLAVVGEAVALDFGSVGDDGEGFGVGALDVSA